MSVIRWEDPPPARDHFQPVALAHDLIAHQLRARPGEWAVVAESPRNVGVAHHIKKGKLRAYAPAGSFEAVARSVDGTYRIYARYIGGEPS